LMSLAVPNRVTCFQVSTGLTVLLQSKLCMYLGDSQIASRCRGCCLLAAVLTVTHHTPT
jgi:hypothetical protein